MSSNSITIESGSLVKQKAYESIMNSIKNRIIDVTSPYAIITKCMSIIQKLEIDKSDRNAILLYCLTKIAAGKDNVSGTDDDIVSVAVVDEIKHIVESGLVDKFVDVVGEIAKGDFSVRDEKDVELVKDVSASCCMIFARNYLSRSKKN